MRGSGDLVLTARGLAFAGRRFPCSVGRGGVAQEKREGDGVTPVGRHRIVGMFYRPDRLARPASWAQAIGPGDLWSDAPEDPAYNQLVRAPYGESHERLRRGDPQYDIVLVTDWNWPTARPHGGSAIFVHQWRRRGAPTAGCIALRRDHLIWIAGRLAPGARLIVPAPYQSVLAARAGHSAS